MKKHLFSLMLIAAFGSYAAAFAQSEIVVGDMNDDGQLTVGDVTALSETVIGRVPQRTISAKCDPDASDPAAIAGHWTVADGAPLTLKSDGTVTSCDDANVKTFEYYPYGRMLVLLDASGNVVKDYLVVRKNKPLLVLQQLDGAYTTHNFVQLVGSITLSEAYLAMQMGEEKRLSATVLPEDAKDRTLTWTSSDHNVAEVSRTGLVYATGDGKCTITATANDGSGVVASCRVVVYKEHDYVDLGLPSGTLWATCNVGADSPEEYGDYFAWGETDPQDEYSWASYKFTQDGYTDEYGCCKYTIADGVTGGCWYENNEFVGDNIRELALEDDAAYMNWGPDWIMPSKQQYEELVKYCNSYWNSSKVGYEFVGPNGKALFFRAAGYYGINILKETHLFALDEKGYYWSRTIEYSTKQAADMNFMKSGKVYIDNWITGYRHNGCSIRPVRATPVSRK